VYTGRWVDAQLDDQARRFHSSPRWLRFDANASNPPNAPSVPTLELSSIYKWFAKDFESQGGRAGASIVSHAARYCPPLRSFLRRGGTVEPTFLPYDWSLNVQK